MTLRILLTGRTGQVGADLVPLLGKIGTLFAPSRSELDLAKPETIRLAIQEFQPQAIVNAAAYTAVDQAEAEEAAARTANAEAVGVIAEQARKQGAAVFHYSTDYVFDGAKRAPYVESDAPSPLNVYGRTKIEGEQALRQSGAAHAIFRTSWVYSNRGRNFLLSILRLAAERAQLRVVKDQIGAPTRSFEIARATAAILSQFAARDGAWPEHLSGTYHMTAAGETSWFEFASAILDHARRAPRAAWFASFTQGAPIRTTELVPITTDQFPTLARRPIYSVLDNSRLKRIFGVALPHWRDQLRSLFEEDEQARENPHAQPDTPREAGC